MPYSGLYRRTPTVMLTWQQRVGACTRVEELLWMVKDFLASWHPYEIAQLPESCRPGVVRHADDLAAYAFNLVRQQCAADAGGRELQRMATFFACAAQRLAALSDVRLEDAANEERA